MLRCFLRVRVTLPAQDRGKYPAIRPSALLAVLSLSIVLFCALVNAQTAAEWPPISPAELALKDDAASSGLAAEVLDRNSHVDDIRGFDTEYFRIKVFREEGRRFADIEIPYLPQNEDVREIRARLVHPDGRAAEFSGEIFDRLIVKSKHLKYQAKVFTLPDVQIGSVFEYSYRITWRRHLPDELKDPSRYSFEGTYSFPTVRWAVQHELFTHHARFSVQPWPNGQLNWSLVRLPNSKVEVQPDKSCVLEVNNVFPIEHEPFMPPPEMANSRVHFFYVIGWPEMFWISTGRRDWQILDTFIGHSRKIAEATSQILAAGDSPDAKLRKIYARVQKIRNVSYEPAKTAQESKQEHLKENKSVEDVLVRGYAYANEINYLFVAMARAAGFDALIVRLADRSRTVFQHNVLDYGQFNASVVLVSFADHNLFLDPATRFCPFGLVPWGEEGVQGLKLISDGSKFVDIPGQKADAAQIKRSATVKISAEGTAEGKFQISYSGQEALTRRFEFHDEDEAGRRKGFEDEIKGWLPEHATFALTSIGPWDSSEEDLSAEGTFTVPEFATLAGSRLLVPVTIFQNIRTNPFQSQQRIQAIYFEHAYNVVDKVAIDYPDSFQVQNGPKGHNDTSDAGHFESKLTPRSRGLDFESSFALSGFVFSPTQYTAVRDLFGWLIASDTETVVLGPVASGT
jgi:hypothetical protein